jgi:CelD/BcsL family acetyltransferase involved in cellulose biosynthesis
MRGGQNSSILQPGVVTALNPLEDSRWDDFVKVHPQSSIFHSAGWLEALHRTYGYRPIVLSTSLQGPLKDGLVFCEIDSWITGRRWVSLPFSDHCDPLTDHTGNEQVFLSSLRELLHRQRLRYFEMRTGQNAEFSDGASPASLSRSTCSYCFHRLNLVPDLNTLFCNLHKDSTQRKIRRAEREGLGYEFGNSTDLLNAFMDLQILTRRRHGLPSQPKHWFRNVLTCLGEAARIRIAYRGKMPIAAIFTLTHKDTVVYKYACSDAAYHNLGGTQMLLWRTIEEAKRNGVRTLDLGRSHPSNTGLVQFKSRLGSAASVLSYSRFTSAISPNGAYQNSDAGWMATLRFQLFSRLPTGLSCAIGTRLYRHIG